MPWAIAENCRWRSISAGTITRQPFSARRCELRLGRDPFGEADCHLGRLSTVGNDDHTGQRSAAGRFEQQPFAGQAVESGPTHGPNRVLRSGGDGFGRRGRGQKLDERRRDAWIAHADDRGQPLAVRFDRSGIGFGRREVALPKFRPGGDRAFECFVEETVGMIDRFDVHVGVAGHEPGAGQCFSGRIRRLGGRFVGACARPAATIRAEHASQRACRRPSRRWAGMCWFTVFWSDANWKKGTFWFSSKSRMSPFSLRLEQGVLRIAVRQEIGQQVESLAGIERA